MVLRSGFSSKTSCFFYLIFLTLSDGGVDAFSVGCLCFCGFSRIRLGVESPQTLFPDSRIWSLLSIFPWMSQRLLILVGTRVMVFMISSIFRVVCVSHQQLISLNYSWQPQNCCVWPQWTSVTSRTVYESFMAHMRWRQQAVLANDRGIHLPVESPFEVCRISLSSRSIIWTWTVSCFVSTSVLCYIFGFRNRISLGSPGWPGICCPQPPWIGTTQYIQKYHKHSWWHTAEKELVGGRMHRSWVLIG